jgi:hypothetical protein
MKQNLDFTMILKENSFIASILGDGFNTTDAWIGMYLTENQMKLWQDQSPVDFTFFEADEPGNWVLSCNSISHTGSTF